MFVYHIAASNYAGMKAIVAGWGATSEAGDPSCVLRDVEVSIMTNLDCVRGTSHAAGMITENMMCAGFADGEEDSCQVNIKFMRFKRVSEYEMGNGIGSSFPNLFDE